MTDQQKDAQARMQKVLQEMQDKPWEEVEQLIIQLMVSVPNTYLSALLYEIRRLNTKIKAAEEAMKRYGGCDLCKFVKDEPPDECPRGMLDEAYTNCGGCELNCSCAGCVEKSKYSWM